MFRRLNPGTAAVFIYCALVACVCLPAARAEESVSVEYKIKAAYLLNFAKFVEWPTNRFPTPTTPIRVGVLGKDPFGYDLERTIGGRVIEGRKCEIVRTDDAEAALSCHIVFISSSERKQMAGVLEKLHRGSVLTVGESEEFIEQGGIIQFYLYENTVRFEINKQQAEKAKLRISSKLLQVAKPPPGKEEK